jgi:hypothetical protein
MKIKKFNENTPVKINEENDFGKYGFMGTFDDTVEKINKLKGLPFSEDNYKLLLDNLTAALQTISGEIKILIGHEQNKK